MTNIFQKVKDAIAANINQAVEENARPDIMARYYADKAEHDVDVMLTKAAEASVDRKNCEDEIKRTQTDIETLKKYAEKAAAANDADGACKCLVEKRNAETRLQALNEALNTLKENEELIIAEYNTMANDLSTMRAQEGVVRATVVLTETKRQKGSRGMQLFRKTKENAQRALAVENQKLSLAASPTVIPASIASKYDESIDNELAALMGNRS